MPKNQPVNSEKNQQTATATASAAEKEKGEVKKFSPPPTDAKELRDMKVNRLLGSMAE